MGRRTQEDHNIRKLGKTTNGSVIVRLPIEIVRKLRWRGGQKVVVKQRGLGIEIKDWKK